MTGIAFLMTTALVAAPLLASAQTQAPAQRDAAKASSEQSHREADIARHRQMARAHEEAARCIEAGTPEKQCQQQLRDACKGIAVGQYCGMRHAH